VTDVEKMVSIRDIGKHEGEQVELRGWIHTKREKGKIIFIVMRDGSGFMQVVLEQERLKPDQWEQAKEASLESSIVVKGVAKSEPRAPGGYEIHADHFEAFHITKDWPLDEKSMVLSSWKKTGICG